MKNTARESRARVLIVLFMIGLIVSGLTAIPVFWEAAILQKFFGSTSWFGNILPGISIWIDRINAGVQNGYGQYPFLAYGTDWLAFGHVAIAVAFIGPLRDPAKNIWVIEFGMIACLLVIPWAIIFSLLRDIPVFWTLIDMSFGLIGIVPLWLARQEILAISAGSSS